MKTTRPGLKSDVLFNYPEFGDRLIIGKFCSIASGTKFIMGPANHRLHSVTTYPFHVFGGLWEERTPDRLSELPFKGDTIIGSDVWLGRECIVMPGVKIGGRRGDRRLLGRHPGRRTLHGRRRQPRPAHYKTV